MCVRQVETSPLLRGKIRKAGRGSAGQGGQQEQTRTLGYKVTRLAALMLLSRFGRRVPVFRWFVAPLVSARRPCSPGSD